MQQLSGAGQPATKLYTPKSMPSPYWNALFANFVLIPDYIGSYLHASKNMYFYKLSWKLC